jgi:hypothetical protein
MPNGFGRGQGNGRGFGSGRGFGFRGTSPVWPYIGLGRGGLPRCGYFNATGASMPLNPNDPLYKRQTAAGRYAASTTNKKDEIDYLRDQAEDIKEQLEKIEARMHDLESE